MSVYAKHVSTRSTPQKEAIPGKPQVQNSESGFVFSVDDWGRLKRFLILGAEGGSYYASERQLTIDNAGVVQRCFAADPKRTVDIIVEVSEAGRAPSNSPAIFALAMCSTDPYALDRISAVCRIGTHLFEYMEAVKHFRGRGRALQRALQNWYLQKPASQVAYQVAKYAQRNGWSHRDVLRLARPKTDDVQMGSVFRYVTHPDKYTPVEGLELLDAVIAAKKASTAGEIVKLIEAHGLVRECIPTQFLNNVAVWEALLQKMPLTALVRNLGKMSAIGLLKPMSNATQQVASKLGSAEYLMRSRVHPMAVLVALGIYKHGHGLRGSLRWNPDAAVVDALDSAFYKCFDNVQPTGKRHMLALDVSGSMTWWQIANTTITPRDASAAMAMVTMKVEPLTHVVAFTASNGWMGYGRSREMTQLAFSKHQRLDDAVSSVSRLPAGGTDCALPMLYAMQEGIDVDTFVIYTDSETYAGTPHPCQALVQYREKTGINAKLIVCAMVSNGFSIADPTDPGMLDVVGFSTDTPAVMAEFSR